MSLSGHGNGDGEEEPPASSPSEWSNMPGDLLSSIAAHLSLADYLRFSAVCTAWLSAANSPLSYPFTNRTPYLLTGERGCGVGGSSFISLFNPAESRSDRLLPSPLPRITTGKWAYVGSQDGWIAAIDPFLNPTLINPLTRSQVPLPPITTLPFIEFISGPPPPHCPDSTEEPYIHYNINCYLASQCYIYHENQFRPENTPLSPTIVYPLPASDVARLSLQKLIFSPSVVVSIFDLRRFLVYYKRTEVGSGRWEMLDRSDWFHDVIFRASDGKLLAAAERDGEVFAYDLSQEPPVKTVITGKRPERYATYTRRYLVEDPSGDLLQVCKRADFNLEENVMEVEWIVVMRLQYEDNGLGVWYPIKRLDEHSIFVGVSHSMCFSAKKAGLKPNSVYFTDDNWDLFEEGNEVVHHAGVYNLQDGTVDLLSGDDHELHLKWPPPIWIAPYPWKQELRKEKKKNIHQLKRL